MHWSVMLLHACMHHVMRHERALRCRRIGRHRDEGLHPHAQRSEDVALCWACRAAQQAVPQYAAIPSKAEALAQDLSAQRASLAAAVHARKAAAVISMLDDKAKPGQLFHGPRPLPLHALVVGNLHLGLCW